MADVFSKSKRSEVMSRIRSRGNKATELALAKLLRRHRITGWRRHIKLRIANDEWRTSNTSGRIRKSKFEIRNFAVRPDFVFRQARLAIFVDGCFWHGCPRHATQPKNNRAFWRRKFSRNKLRDKLVNHALRRANWRVIRIWECRLRKSPESCLRRIMRGLTGSARVLACNG